MIKWLYGVLTCAALGACGGEFEIRPQEVRLAPPSKSVETLKNSSRPSTGRALKVIDVGPFRFSTSVMTLEEQPVQAIDSLVKNFTATGMHLSLDYGFYSEYQSHTSAVAMIVDNEVAMTYTTPCATIQVKPEFETCSVIHFADIGGFEPPLKLTMKIASNRADSNAEAQCIFSSIDFAYND